MTQPDNVSETYKNMKNSTFQNINNFWCKKSREKIPERNKKKKKNIENFPSQQDAKKQTT